MNPAAVATNRSCVAGNSTHVAANRSHIATNRTGAAAAATDAATNICWLVGRNQNGAGEICRLAANVAATVRKIHPDAVTAPCVAAKISCAGGLRVRGVTNFSSSVGTPTGGGTNFCCNGTNLSCSAGTVRRGVGQYTAANGNLRTSSTTRSAPACPPAAACGRTRGPCRRKSRGTC